MTITKYIYGTWCLLIVCSCNIDPVYDFVDASPDSDSSTDADADSDTDSDTDSDVDTDGDTDTDTGSETDSGTDTDSETNSDTDSSCEDGLISCDGNCIDPLTDNDFCGASGNCEGTNAGEDCDLTEECTNGICNCQPSCDDVECGLDPICKQLNCGSCSIGNLCDDGLCAPAMISAGFENSCAVLTSGKVLCWGEDEYGQIGNGGGNEIQPTPTQVSGFTSDGAAEITVGDYHICAVTTSGGAKCWGRGEKGRLGDGEEENRQTPVDVFGMTNGVKSISAGSHFTCALLTSGAVMCWGGDYWGQLGNGSDSDDKLKPVAVSDLGAGVLAISAGYAHACALIDDGTVKCWGRDSEGQLGNDDEFVNQSTPVKVFGLQNVVAISAGTLYTCALQSNGEIKCWGSNLDGQLGDGKENDKESTPVAVKNLGADAVAVACGGYHTCAILDSGGVKCWGRDRYGQLGDGGDNENKNYPTQVFGLVEGAVSLSTGSDHTCALFREQNAMCWGRDSTGTLGDGSVIQDQMVPVDVIGIP